MKVLELITDDYTITAQGSNQQKLWARFKSRLYDKAYTYCDYASTIQGKLYLSDSDDSNNLQVDDMEGATKWERRPPVFFETNSYNFAIKFKNIIGVPSIIHPNKSVAEMFSYFQTSDGGILTGTINFLNEIGKFTLRFSYDTPILKHQVNSFTFDVVSPKLDIKDDYKSILETINHEYNELVYRYLTLTFQQFGKQGHSKSELIWLVIFQDVIRGYLRACNFVINKPHYKMKGVVYFQKPDRIKHWTPRLEERFKEEESKLDSDVLGRFFRNDRIDITIDTQENRFVKYTVIQIRNKLHRVINRLKTNYGDVVSEEYKSKLDNYEFQLDKLFHNKMFHAIGKFEGFRQESIVLQKRTGYAQIYRYWLMLQSGLSLFDGTIDIGMKQMWELYEIWCFLKMKEMIGSLEHIEMCKENKESMLNPFLDNKIEHCVFYKNTQNGDEIELKYQHTYNRTNHEITHTETTEQRPDIVLNIHKSDFIMTYLYDAKYRVWDDIRTNASNIADEPVPDAINQMHRYRDAIYYGTDRKYLAKEVIGAYVLFPGRGKDEDIRKQYYQKSIETINIGAFPLLPNSDKENEGKLLKEHLRKIILEKTKFEQITNSIPQKGLDYKEIMSD